MTRREIAGLKVVKNTLEPNRMEVIVNIMDRGPYGQIEDWNGEIVIEVSPSCHMGEDVVRIIAQALAENEIYRAIKIHEWDYCREGSKIRLVPKDWDEVDVDSGLRIH